MGFSDDEIAAFKEVFGYYLTEKDKTVILSEDLGLVMRNLGKNPLEAELEEIMKEHGNKTMDFDDLVKFMGRPLKETSQPSEKEILSCFQLFDDEGNGKIEKNEFRKIMKDIGEGLTAKEFEIIMAECDPEVDGFVDYRKIVEVMFAKDKEHK